MDRGAKRFNFVSFILLIVLIVLFNRELYILGVRIYAAVTNNAEADHLLAGYYRTTARQNADYANHFYQESLNKYLDKAVKAPEAEKAQLNLTIGRFFECSRGARLNLEKAKMFYLEAAKSAKDSPNKTTIEIEVQDALKRVDTEIQELPQQPSCVNTSDKEFFGTLFTLPSKNGEDKGNGDSGESKK